MQTAYQCCATLSTAMWALCSIKAPGQDFRAFTSLTEPSWVLISDSLMLSGSQTVQWGVQRKETESCQREKNVYSETNCMTHFITADCEEMSSITSCDAEDLMGVVQTHLLCEVSHQERNTEVLVLQTKPGEERSKTLSHRLCLCEPTAPEVCRASAVAPQTENPPPVRVWSHSSFKALINVFLTPGEKGSSLAAHTPKVWSSLWTFSIFPFMHFNKKTSRSNQVLVFHAHAQNVFLPLWLFSREKTLL